jgi:hypothetical protein
MTMTSLAIKRATDMETTAVATAATAATAGTTATAATGATMQVQPH